LQIRTPFGIGDFYLKQMMLSTLKNFGLHTQIL